MNKYISIFTLMLIFILPNGLDAQEAPILTLCESSKPNVKRYSETCDRYSKIEIYAVHEGEMKSAPIDELYIYISDEETSLDMYFVSSQYYRGFSWGSNMDSFSSSPYYSNDRPIDFSPDYIDSSYKKFENKRLYFYFKGHSLFDGSMICPKIEYDKAKIKALEDKLYQLSVYPQYQEYFKIYRRDRDQIFELCNRLAGSNIQLIDLIYDNAKIEKENFEQHCQIQADASLREAMEIDCATRTATLEKQLEELQIKYDRLDENYVEFPRGLVTTLVIFILILVAIVGMVVRGKVFD